MGEPGPATLQHATRIILIQYDARLPPRSDHFSWPSPQVLLRIQDDLYTALFSKESVDATQQPSSRYEKLFVRELYERLNLAVEEECDRLRHEGVDPLEFPEVSESLLNRYAELSSTEQDESEHEITRYWWSHDKRIGTELEGQPAGCLDSLHGFSEVTLREATVAISRGTTGLKTWEAGLRLGAHLLANHSELIEAPGTGILELGSGTGFLGALCLSIWRKSRSSGSELWLTDVTRPVLDRIRDTLNDNMPIKDEGCQRDSVHVEALDWLELQAERRQSEQRDDLPTIQLLQRAKPTLVLAADVVYDPELVGALAETIRACLEAGPRGNCRALVASTIRNPATYLAFKKALEAENLSFEVIALDRPRLLSPDEARVPSIQIFPSTHDPARDGVVELLQITV